MQVGERKLKDLLHSGDQFIIPVFQREYVWRERDWERLWDDLCALEEADGPPEHFMGSIVSVPSHENQPGQPSRYLVIDGQQRLITFTALLCALRDHAKSYGLDKLAAQVQKSYLIHEFGEGLARYKVLPRIRDRQQFFDLVDEKAIVDKSRIREVYSYFFQKMGALDGDAEASLRSMLNAVTARLSLVTITLQPDQNPFAIFATLNATGQKLEEADLIRNYVFMGVPLPEQDDFDAQQWIPFEARFLAIGEHKAVDLTDFYRDYLMRDGAYVRRDEVYIGFERDSSTKALSRSELVAQLERYATLYLWIHRPDSAPTPAIQRELLRTKRLEQSTSYPLILNLLARYDAGALQESEVVECLRAVQSFVLRRAITNWSTRAYGRIFTTTIGEIKDDRVLSSLTLFLARKGWPRDASFRESLLSYPIYRSWPNLTRLVLVAIEDLDSNLEKVDVDRLLDTKPPTLTIEHVMPQGIGDDPYGEAWKKELGADWEDVHHTWLHSIGNLTLTAYNATLSNKPFPKKRAEFLDSTLRMNRWFVKHDRWTATEIEQRGTELVDRIAKAWPSAEEFEPLAALVKLDPGDVPSRPSRYMGPIRLEFWTYVASYLEDTGSSAWLRPDERSWVTAGSGTARGETYAQARTNLGTFSVQYLSNAYTTRSLFNWLLSNREAIQAVFPERLTWVDTPASYQQYFEVSCGSDIEDRDAWPRLAAWYGERLEALRKVIGPLVGRWVAPDPERGCSPELFRACLSETNPELAAPAERLIEWAERHLPEADWPTDRNIPAWTPYLKKKGVWYSLPRLIADGSLQLQLPTLKKRPPFDDAAVRAELMRQLNELRCVDLPPEAADKYVKLPFAMFAEPDVLDDLLRVLDWFVDRVHSAATS